ncbi:MAG: bifunctional 4-hydroxy-2-oxoglutarate aldolase/2-dehydro-3-deoxy-phosphogluconate aldolase [Saprospiraceae bacterium]|nr:bifunctional 4-hydroxy-2-oxoglutarate aldolase/2-dehydro-3-deoxy-phosphogluconate aldolase [Saprospiraceae bacterium]
MNAFNHPAFEAKPVVGILRNFTFDEVKIIATAYQDAGLTTLEITMNSPDALKSITYLAKNHPGLNIGAGTVCTPAEMSQAMEAGASFIVTPVCNLELIKSAYKSQIPIFPGALTPSEIYQAWEAGATAVKIFPASAFGAPYIKEVLAPLSQIKLLPTGGIHAGNMKDYFLAGAIGVGMGSALVGKKEDLSDKNVLLTKMKKIADLLASLLP